MNKFMTIILYLLSVVVICLFIYGSYWIAKSVSYSMWYEDMVEKTVREMVKKEALK